MGATRQLIHKQAISGALLVSRETTSHILDTEKPGLMPPYILPLPSSASQVTGSGNGNSVKGWNTNEPYNSYKI